MQEGEEKYVFTDSFKTKDLIWDAYYGFKKHFGDYLMYCGFNKMDPITQAGLFMYAGDFYYETRNMFKDFENKLGSERVLKVHQMFKEKNHFNKEEYVFLRVFFNDFMDFSGIKKIVKQKDTMSAFAKSQSEM